MERILLLTQSSRGTKNAHMNKSNLFDISRLVIRIYDWWHQHLRLWSPSILANPEDLLHVVRCNAFRSRYFATQILPQLIYPQAVVSQYQFRIVPAHRHPDQ